jgi:hypothetical protein
MAIPSKEGLMSNETVVSMRELELEAAELLPSRETLNVSKCHPSSHGYSYSSYSVNQVGNSSGLINVPILSGDDYNTIAIF